MRTHRPLERVKNCPERWHGHPAHDHSDCHCEERVPERRGNLGLLCGRRTQTVIARSESPSDAAIRALRLPPRRLPTRRMIPNPSMNREPRGCPRDSMVPRGTPPAAKACPPTVKPIPWRLRPFRQRIKKTIGSSGTSRRWPDIGPNTPAAISAFYCEPAGRTRRPCLSTHPRPPARTRPPRAAAVVWRGTRY
jgi:hypothetical protein